MAPPTVAVVGTGLAGLSAAYELSIALQSELPEAHVVVFEKNKFLGGNSMKASSGINAVNPAAEDTEAIYAEDTRKSGGGLSKEDLVAQLVNGSQDGIAFLEGLGLNISTIVRLGGHSKPRTRSNPAGPNVGTYLVKAVAARVQAAANVEVKLNSKVVSIEDAKDGRLSVTYAATAPRPAAAADGSATAAAAAAAPEEQQLVVNALVLATGGFGASKEMLREHSPAVAELPTTNGDWAQGEGIQLGAGLGASLLHMEQVQVHPTGFVDPADPTAGTKWLAPEKLRGCGAILLNSSGRRFVDELTTRDKVTGALMGQEGRVAWLLLGVAGAAMFGEGTLGFYGSKGLVKKFDTLEAAAQHMGLQPAELQQQLEQYNTAAAGSDPFGKQFFPTTLDPAGHFWLGQITPVVHYCMGGLEINDKAQVLSKQGSPIRGLFAAGEVSGGLHGANRLGGNSLAECVVFGRIAGQAAAAHVLPEVLVQQGTAGMVDMMSAKQSVVAAL
uniref:fumarate reductase (NADH) n=1 Tax=Tetradesmus obliquus TaxID=3088 RepID=A0A383VWI0_TETOB|eukprot:jgi/Sobl393_1/10568/SZX69124.1